MLVTREPLERYLELSPLLDFDHPEVQVVNLPRRFRTVGEKMNAAVALASHDLLFVWDDDDLFLPQFTQTYLQAK